MGKSQRDDMLSCPLMNTDFSVAFFCHAVKKRAAKAALI
uniref:Uncharacterized protein n=1 Tax=Rheinheimera sp. BAL341 TaxID=1708203 RepID=A0A486XQI5_9GAMM